MFQAFSTFTFTDFSTKQLCAASILKGNSNNKQKTLQVLIYLQPNNILRQNMLYFQFLALNKADCKEHLKAAFLSRYNSSPASNNRTDNPNHS